jgi:uncharacterized membrane protein YbaN (DUF454 family)
MTQTKVYRTHLEAFAKHRQLSLSRKLMLTTFSSSMLLLAYLTLSFWVLRMVIALTLVGLHGYFWLRINTQSNQKPLNDGNEKNQIDSIEWK